MGAPPAIGLALSADDHINEAVTSPRAAGPAGGLRPPANRVSRRAIWYWLTTAAIGWLAIIAVQVVAWVFDWPIPPWRPQVLAGTVLLAIGHLAVMPIWRYRVHRWELTDGAVYVRTGWWSQEWRIAPVTRVQTVDTERGPVARLFRLAKVTVTTASAAGPLAIDGLDDPVAVELADEVTAAAQAAQNDAT